MKPYKIQRLWNNYASVRSYIVEQHIRNKEALIIEYGNLIMTIPVQKLNTYKQLSKKVFESKYNGGNLYTLYDYLFQPDKIEEKKNGNDK
jgi:hypothetical protein